MKRFLCKALLDRDTSPAVGTAWALSKRCFLRVGEDYFRAGDTRVPFSEITTASLRIVPSAFFVPSCILTVKTSSGRTHHFGLTYSKYWKGTLPFAVQRSHVKAPLLWLRRAIIVGILGYIVWDVVSDFL